MKKLGNSNTIIILGDSPFLNTVENKVAYVLERYLSIGINRVINRFSTTYQILTDVKIIPVANKHLSIPTISLYAHGDMIRKENKILIDTYTFDVKKDTENDIVKDGKLAWCGFTHDYAISYAIFRGWRNIVLIGAADFIQGTHFSNEEKFNPSLKLQEDSKKFINNFCTKRANIFTCNPDSCLQIPYLDIDELLKFD